MNLSIFIEISCRPNRYDDRWKATLRLSTGMIFSISPISKQYICRHANWLRLPTTKWHPIQPSSLSHVAFSSFSIFPISLGSCSVLSLHAANCPLFHSQSLPLLINSNIVIKKLNRWYTFYLSPNFALHPTITYRDVDETLFLFCVASEAAVPFECVRCKLVWAIRPWNTRALFLMFYEFVSC